MKHLPNTKWFKAYNPVSGTTDDALSSAIDATGASYMTVLVHVGAIATTWTTFEITNSAATSGTYASVTGGDITDAVIGTAAMPANGGIGVNALYQFQVPVDQFANKFWKIKTVVGSGATVQGMLVGLEDDNADGNNSDATNTGCTAVIRVPTP